MSAKRIKDKILYLRLKQKDKDAFIKAYDSYIEDIYRFIYFKVGNREDAEDITSQVFLKSWDYIQNNNLLEYKTIKPFFYRVARNSIVDYYRDKSDKENISINNENNKIDVIDEKVDLNKEVDLKNDIKNLQEAMQELKNEYREVLLLRYINELSVKEIAEILEKNKGNVRVLIFRAIKALKNIVSADNV